MNEFVQAVHDSAAFGGEFKKMLLVCASVGIFGVVCWAIQEWGSRELGVALVWLGAACLGMIGFGAVMLVSVGMI
jgi:hypothetical protein